MDKRELANGTASPPKLVRRQERQVWGCHELRPRGRSEDRAAGTWAKAPGAGTGCAVPCGGCWDGYGLPHILVSLAPGRECLIGQLGLRFSLTVGYGPKDSGLKSSFLMMDRTSLPPRCHPMWDSSYDRQVPCFPRCYPLSQIRWAGTLYLQEDTQCGFPIRE